MARKRSRKNLTTILDEGDSQAAGFFEVDTREGPLRSARVAAVPLSQCFPDRFQARIILPPDVKRKFFFGELDCYQAAGILLESAPHDAGLHRQVEDLLALGENILQVGQIEPATGSWITGPDGRPVFAIEVGERRFWSLALVAVQVQLEDEPNLQVIEEAVFSRERQISENVQREGNTAVDRARAIAGLILLQLQVEPDPDLLDDLDYFRQVNQVGRLPNGTWPPIAKQMKMSRTLMQRHLNILNLPTELVYLAKLYDVPEARLREVLAAPPEDWSDLLYLALDPAKTAEDIRRAAQGSTSAKKKRAAAGNPSAPERAASRVRSLMRLLRKDGSKRHHEQIATEYSVAVPRSEDLLLAADQLEQLARWMRILHRRREG